MTPTKRSLELMRKRGYVCEVVERWNPFARVRHDLFGCIDILCMPKDGKEKGLTAIQTTSAGHVSDRIKKALSSPNLKHWCESGNHFFVHGWGKRGAKGKRKLWTVTEKYIVP